MGIEREFGFILVRFRDFTKAQLFRQAISASSEDRWAPNANIVEGGVSVSLRGAHVDWFAELLESHRVSKEMIVGEDAYGNQLARTVRNQMNDEESIAELRKGSK